MMKSPQLRSIVAIAGTAIFAGLFAWLASTGAATVDTPIGAIPLFVCATILAFLIQWVVFIPSMIANTEKYFDLTGAITYITISVFLLISAPAVNVRSAILGSLVIIWALRLGSFLFLRVRKAGKDDRFDERKKSRLRFLVVWTVQGLWVTITASAAWIAITADASQAIDGFLIVGTAIWLLGFVIEVIADVQKNRFRANPDMRGQFISTGLWSRSRHPNYFGEIVLWTGVAIIALPAFSGWQFLGLLSPFFVALLLIKGSGIPLLEKKADEKWGDSKEYQTYRSTTPVLVPRVLPQRAK